MLLVLVLHGPLVVILFDGRILMVLLVVVVLLMLAHGSHVVLVSGLGCNLVREVHMMHCTINFGAFSFRVARLRRRRNQ